MADPTPQPPIVRRDPELAAAEEACTVREALYAQAIASGAPQTAAAQAAGVSSYSAARMKRSPAIGGLIKRLRQETAEDLRITRNRIAQEVARVAFSSQADVLEVDEEGNVTFRNDMDQDALAAIESIEQSPTQYGDKRKITFWPKIAALKLLSELLGYTTDGSLVPLGAAGILAGKSPLEAAEYALNLTQEVARIRAQAEALEGRPLGDGS